MDNVLSGVLDSLGAEDFKFSLKARLYKGIILLVHVSTVRDTSVEDYATPSDQPHSTEE